MRTPVKIAAFGAALAVAFGGAFGVGATVGSPIGASQDTHGADHGAGTNGEGDTDGTKHGNDHGGEAAGVPGGLMVSESGYTLELAQDSLPAGSGAPLSFRVLGTGGEPVTSYQESHDKEVHLIAVRRDMTGFQHVHPELAADGTWSVPLDLTAGTWRVFADFVPGEGDAAGETLTLGADLAVAGDYQPSALPAQVMTTDVEGYTVTLEGDLVPGEESELTLSVSQGGQPVTDLQPYLGAYGHLVALRDGDLAYLHVHPAGEPGDGDTDPGPDITFYATAPSTGDYRLFLDFQHQGSVRTAEFTAQADGTLTADSTADTTSDPADGQEKEQEGGHVDDDHDH